MLSWGSLGTLLWSGRVSACGQWSSQLPLSWRSSKVMFDSWTHLIVLDVLLPLILTTALFLGIITGEEPGYTKAKWLIVVIQPLSRVRLSDTTRGTASCQASLSFIPSQSLLMFTNACSFSQRCHPTIRPLLASSPPTFSLSQHQGLFQWVGSSHQVARKYWASASVLVLPMNIHGWFPLGLTGLISFLSKGLSRIFSSTKASILQCSAFFMVQLSSPYMTTGKNHSFDYTDVCWQSDVSAF